MTLGHNSSLVSCSVLLGLLSVLALVSFVARVIYLKRERKLHGLGRTGLIYWPTQIFMGTAALSAFVSALLSIIQSSEPSPAAITGYFALGSAWGLAVFLNYYEHLYTIRSSDLIFSYYVLSISALSIHARTLNILSETSTEVSLQLITIWAMIASLLLGFIVEAWPRGHTKVQQASTATIYEKANLFSQVTYYFYQSIISRSVKRTLTPDDVANLLPDSIVSSNAHARLNYYWTRATQSAKAKHRAGWSSQNLGHAPAPSLFRVILRFYRPKMPAMVALRLSRVFANYAVPAILSLLLAYFQDIQHERESAYAHPDIEPSRIDVSGYTNTVDGSSYKTSLEYGLTLAIAMFLAGLANAVLLVVTRQYYVMCGLQVRAALISMVYRKALRLSPGAKQKSTTGAITNHMSVDADIWGDGVIFLTMGISIPAEIAIGIWLLYLLLGWSAGIGLLVLVALSPLQIWRGRAFSKLQRQKWTQMDERIRLTTETLSAIKVVKLYAWESPFLKKILNVRNRELGVLRRMGMVSAVMSTISSSSTVIVCLITLSVYAAWGGPDFTPIELSPQAVFVSMTLFAMLKTPITSISEAITSVVSLLVSTQRIQDFLFQEETDKDAIVRELDISKRQPDEPLVLIRDGTFAWTKQEIIDASTAEEIDEADEARGLLFEQEEEEARGRNTGFMPTLKKISLSIDNESLVAVVGRIGQGKSSLISAIIGEMYKVQGHIKTIGRIAYVPQQAWILNATLRENILFGKDFDHDRYYRVLRACGLEPDVEMLPAGDLTEIGERGINLSGGQKQRVSLARAVYDDADIYLLDDPLSAVDAHVDQHLWTNVVGPQGLLCRKTRILVTHGIHHLQQVDRIILLKDGRVEEDGRYEELMVAEGVFGQLIKEYSVTHREELTAAAEAVQVESTGASRTGRTAESSGIVAKQAASDTETSSQASTGEGTVKDVAKGKVQRDNRNKGARRNTSAQLVAAEKIEVGDVRMSVVKGYLDAFSYKYTAIVIALHVLTQICLVSTNLWLKHWINTSKENSDENPPSLWFFILVFTILTFAHVGTCVVLFWVAFAVARIRASKQLHQHLMATLMRLPPAFFDTTPVLAKLISSPRLGRIINRVSSDIASIDDRLPAKLFEATLQAVSLLASLTVVAVTTPVFLFAAPFMFAAYRTIQSYYLHASRACKRMFQVTKSPIFQHFQETLGGVSTIRAMGLQDRFIQANAAKNDLHTNVYVALGYCIRWVEIQTQLMSCLVTLMASLWFVLATRDVDGNGRSVVDAATAGLALSFAMNISQSLIWFTRTYCDLFTHLISVERVQELAEMKTEAPLWTDPDSEAGWALEQSRWPPQRGSIAFVDYSTRYREGLDLVLKHVSFVVDGEERVGIVGRTGAGKSSLTLALFRMVEAANSYWARASDNSGRPIESNSTTDDADNGQEENIDGGKIEIDGINVSTLGLADLRQQLAIIPQEPVLFAGSIRENLDPFQELEDVVLWEALGRAHLKDHISSLPGRLSFEVSQNGENFSVGQRSLICLARALLRKTKILILDEATSAVDVETDELIQRTIRTEFKDRTILTIAHRIKTVMDSDKILVLDQGCVVEYDSPKALIHRETSLFHKLAKQAGEL
ncbi:hypothetical protein BGZ54_010349 [Gamsiella multidivaricata]|nr:hypothetical protein BGZ54_010349 [Gamsiella multidivaricata]